MESQRAVAAGSRICSPPPGLTAAAALGCPDCPPARGLCCGVLPPCKPGPTAAPGPGPAGNAVYTVLVDESLLRRKAGSAPAPGRPGQLQQQGAIHCSGQVGPEELLPGQKAEDPWGLGSWDEVGDWDQSGLLQSAYIPVPKQRCPPGKAGLDEVMAAAVLTSLSTSPLILGPPSVPFSPESCCDPWKESSAGPSGSYSSSNNSGDWGWDPPSDQSSPSTPSPPLPPEAAHFLFGDPTPRKRKNSVKVMFKCLWKSCGKVLSTSSGIQKHIRTVHLGRRAEPDQSDGEEDFYYTELDINVDSLTDGLSSLTPMSPTSSVPPAFPSLDLPVPAPSETTAMPTILSSVVPTTLCHVHTDHAYQGCLTPVHSVGISDKGPQLPQSTVIKPPVPTISSGLKPSTGIRKPRGEAKKCRKVYGMENRDMWCTACRWKKACQRFLD
ncbi:SLC2A4 regulator isoform X1 [Vombatus ursinus]|uniref:SLC2A4 regulator isoform X1 n=1 Tax=Vombatus ursinus TaxID=29139 RepID=UPI000FFD26D1|nr:SLC2A4 regulator isoform X1 [Vombatus ursinus]